jgi:Pyruvate/2-oxoacid:ferredoxin oxidoreductase gamma subunit
MLGAFTNSGLLPFPKTEIKKVLLEMAPEKAKAMNERAFDMGSMFEN